MCDTPHVLWNRPGRPGGTNAIADANRGGATGQFNSGGNTGGAGGGRTGGPNPRSIAGRRAATPQKSGFFPPGAGPVRPAADAPGLTAAADKTGTSRGAGNGRRRRGGGSGGRRGGLPL